MKTHTKVTAPRVRLRSLPWSDTSSEPGHGKSATRKFDSARSHSRSGQGAKWVATKDQASASVGELFTEALRGELASRFLEPLERRATPRTTEPMENPEGLVLARLTAENDQLRSLNVSLRAELDARDAQIRELRVQLASQATDSPEDFILNVPPVRSIRVRTKRGEVRRGVPVITAEELLVEGA